MPKVIRGDEKRAAKKNPLPALPEHRQQHNRVDIVCGVTPTPGVKNSISGSGNSNASRSAGMRDVSQFQLANKSQFMKAYTNQSFAANDSNLTSSSSSYHFSSPPNDVRLQQPQRPQQQRLQRQPVVWSTSSHAIHLESAGGASSSHKPKSKNTHRRSADGDGDDEPRANGFICSHLPCLLIGLLAVALIAATVVLIFVLTSSSDSSSSSNIDNSEEGGKQVDTSVDTCVPECESSKYCVSFTPSNATCVCKPGYRPTLVNEYTTYCEQQACYQGYKPYTYVSSVEYQSQALPPDTQYLRPYCCPNGEYLTSACCGIAPQKAAFSFSKRIIGGEDIAGDGIFPWIVCELYAPCVLLSLFCLP